jgi:hypothetical protein
MTNKKEQRYYPVTTHASDRNITQIELLVAATYTATIRTEEEHSKHQLANRRVSWLRRGQLSSSKPSGTSIGKDRGLVRVKKPRFESGRLIHCSSTRPESGQGLHAGCLMDSTTQFYSCGRGCLVRDRIRSSWIGADSRGRKANGFHSVSFLFAVLALFVGKSGVNVM